MSEPAGEPPPPHRLPAVLLLFGGGVLMLLILAATLAFTVFLVDRMTRTGPSPRRSTAIFGAQVIRKAAEIARELDGLPGCPTVQDLVDAHQLEAARATDPYGTPYRIDCTGDDIRVWSSGPDRVPGTADDLSDDMAPWPG